MNNLGMISFEHIAVLLVVNILGFFCIGLIGYIINNKTTEPKTKLVVSAKVGLVSVLFFAVISGDIGIYLWINSGNFWGMMIAIPLIFCLGPFMFPIVATGTYIQLLYRDKIQGYVDSHKR